MHFRVNKLEADFDDTIVSDVCCPSIAMTTALIILGKTGWGFLSVGAHMAGEADLRTEGMRALGTRDHGGRWRVAGPCFPWLPCSPPLFCCDGPVGLTSWRLYAPKSATWLDPWQSAPRSQD